MGRYAIFNGLVYGGGTDVIPNPEGTPTDELHSIQIDEDIYEIVGGGGGASAIEKTQAEYDALTPAQKTNGAIYMVRPNEDTIVELTEAQTDDTRVTASSYGYDSNFQQYHRPWCAFNRVSPTTWSYPTPGVTNETAWVPNIGTDGSNSWIQYEFDKAESMTSMKILAFADYSSSTTKSMIIEGSNDGETWDNILAEGSSFTLTATLHENYENEVDLDPTNAYKYVRLRSLEPMGASYQPSVFIDEIYVYGYGATDDAHKIYYMGTEYANTNGGSGGGGDGYKIEKIFDGNVTTSGNITLTKNLNNYDELVFITNFTRELGESYISSFNVDVSIFKNIGSYTATRGVLLNDWSKDTRFAQVKYVDDTTIDVESIQVISIVEIYGVKHSAGGGGGSTVVPNPQEEPTDTLNTVEIDGVVYNIEGGSEGGQGLNPANYSTEEEIIGVWTNNLPVYKKTWTFSSAITVGSGSWANTSISVNDTQIHTIVNCEAVGPNGQAWTCISATTDEATQTYVRILNTRDTDVAVKHLTLYYIKDGDSPIVPPGTDGIYNFYGMFVDTNNEILPQTAISSTPYEYTATENCFVGYYLPYTWANDSTADVYIDNVKLIAQYGQGNTWGGSLVPLKKGQVIKFINGNYSSGGFFWVYGATYSINCSSGVGIETYSTAEEYKIGKWIDGKTLYQKTLSTTLSGNQGSIDVSSLDIDNGWIVDGYYDIGVTKLGLNEYMTSSSYTYTHMNDNLTPPYIDCKNTISADSTIYVTIKYTKNTEIVTPAWTGIGTSLVDYSTSEKIVGTWLDGSSIYQKTFVLSSPVVLTSGDWTVISEVNIPNADASIYTEVFYSSPKIQLTAAGRFDNGALSIFLPFTFRTDKVTVRYTKTTT